MRKFILWFLGILLAVGVLGAMLSAPPAGSNATAQSKTSALDQKRQRVSSDKQAEADFQRMDKLNSSAFCTKELPKLRTTKLTAAQIEAIELQSQRFLVDSDEFDHVKKKTVRTGISSCTVLAAWGKPERVNSTQGAGYSQEQWVYNRDYVYVQNHRVTSLQTSR